MSKKQKVLMTTLVVGLAGAIAGFGVFAAFSSTTSNPSNSFQAGTVTIGDNDGGTALFSNAVPKGPGNHDRCVKVTYSGTLDATVKLYTSAITGTGSDLNVTIAKGTGAAADCSDFVSASTVFGPDTLANFRTANNSFTNGLAVNPGSATKWVANDAVTFRFRITVPDANSAQGKVVDPFTLTWEAQNQ
jgi:predicted ribosomally synthesized peptide with SipW-like signal peptide